MSKQESKPRDPELVAIGERIRLVREEQGFARERLAELAETSSQFLAQVEKGEQSMTTLKLKKLSAALKVSCDYLLFGQPPLDDLSALAVDRLTQISPVDRDFLVKSLLQLCRLLEEATPDHA